MTRPGAKLRAHSDGFTLVELLIVILIIGILLAIALPTFLGQQAKGQDAAAKTTLNTGYKVASADAVKANTREFDTIGNLVTAINNSDPELQAEIVTIASDAQVGHLGVVTAGGNTLVLAAKSASGCVFTLTVVDHSAPEYADCDDGDVPPPDEEEDEGGGSHWPVGNIVWANGAGNCSYGDLQDCPTTTNGSGAIMFSFVSPSPGTDAQCAFNSLEVVDFAPCGQGQAFGTQCGGVSPPNCPDTNTQQHMYPFFMLGGLSEGDNYWSVRFVDGGGTQVGSVSTLHFDIDNTPPAPVAIDNMTPATGGGISFNGSSMSPSIIGSGGGPDVVSVQVYNNGSCNFGSIASGSIESFTGAGIQLPEWAITPNGSTLLTVKARDDAGNTSACSSAVAYTQG